MSHPQSTIAPPSVLAEAEQAYRALRELVSTGTRDLTALRAARARFAQAAAVVADHTSGAQRALWRVHATCAPRELRDGFHNTPA